MDSDPIDKFLNQFPSREESAELRIAVQNKTLAVLRRRRWIRRAGWVTGLAACYLAGILTTWMIRSFQPELRIADQPTIQTDTQGDKSPAAPMPESPKTIQQPETALALEWKACDSETRRPDLFRLAGDRYLEANDLESATRCYKSALRGASDKELQVTVNDTWLFMSLKQAKQEENRYAKLTGR
jgi:hypothetical protein